MDSALKGSRPITEEDAQNITRVEELGYELKICEVMTRDLRILTNETLMSDVLELFRSKHISGAPVLDNGTLVGLVSIEDLIRCMRKGDLSASVKTYMSTDLITIHDFDPVVEALKIFVTRYVGRLPVLDANDALVGMITKGDITRGLLSALQRDFQVEEIRRYRASHLFEDIVSDRTSLILRYHIRPRDFTHGGSASSYIKRALLRLGASPQIARRCGIAVYEAEMNLIIHTTSGGTIRVEIEPHQITIEAIDDGPGINDVNLAMKPGWSTATDEIREKGFGAGMGLVNISRCIDDMKIDSTPGKGTHLRLKIYLRDQESFAEERTNQERSQP
jgi:anti-sigma regulatory factor (Ser/Thr protein kinase)/CBS domain-containing protein